MIHALPGMGADHRMYPAPWSTLPSFIASDWPRYAGEITIEDIARSFCAANRVVDGDILVGASLGGMVAGAITRIRHIPQLYLIGSAVHPGDVNALLSALHPLAKIAPIDLLRFSAGSIPADLSQMFATVDALFLRAMCAAIFDWKGLGMSDTQVFRVHGLHDHVIPPPRTADLFLDGGHLIAMTHAQECVDFIRANLPPSPSASEGNPATETTN